MTKNAKNAQIVDKSTRLVKTDTFSLKINKISACAVFAFFAPVHYVEFQ